MAAIECEKELAVMMNSRCFICLLSSSSAVSKQDIEDGNVLTEFGKFTKEFIVFNRNDTINTGINVKKDGDNNNVGAWRNSSVCDICRPIIKSVLEKRTQVNEVESRVLKLQTELLLELRCLECQLGGLYEDMTLIEQKMNNAAVSSSSQANHQKRTRNRDTINTCGRDTVNANQCFESLRREILTVINNLLSFRSTVQSKVWSKNDCNNSRNVTGIKGNPDPSSIIVKSELLSDQEDSNNSLGSDFYPEPDSSDYDQDLDDREMSSDDDYEPPPKARKSLRKISVNVVKSNQQEQESRRKSTLKRKVKATTSNEEDTLEDTAERKEKAVKCPDCGKPLKNINCLRKHKWRSCSAGKVGKTFPCPSCTLSFRTKLLLNRHQKKVHPVIDTRTSFDCPICSKSFRNKYYLTVHRKAVHEHRYSCELCGKMFSKMASMKIHQANAHGQQDQEDTNTFSKCSVCGRLSKSHQAHLKHMETHKNLEDRTTETCSFCKQEMLSSNMRSHLARFCPAKTSKIQAPIACYLCGESFSNRLKLKLHVQNGCSAAANNTADNFTCYLCGKQGFKTRVLLKKHVQRHGSSARRQFMCGRCGGSFTANAHLKRHEKWCDGSKIPRKPRNGDMLQAGPCYDPIPWTQSDDAGSQENSELKVGSSVTENNNGNKESNFEMGSMESEAAVSATSKDVCDSNSRSSEEFDNAPNAVADSDDDSTGRFDGTYTDDSNSSDYDEPPKLENEKVSIDNNDLNDDTSPSNKSSGSPDKMGEISLIDEAKKDLPQKEYSCTVCSKVYGSLLGLRSHQRTHSQAGAKFACQFCPKTYSTKIDFAVHLANIHKQPAPGKLHLYECSVCGTKRANEDKMKLHEETHLKLEERTRRICEYCGKGILPKSYASHVQNNCPGREGKGEQQVICPECGNGYENAFKLRRHMERIHTPDWGAYACEICGKTGFKNKQSLGVHTKKHTTGRKRDLKCSQCGGGFTTASHLNRHEKGCDGSKKPRKPRYASMILPTTTSDVTL